MKQPSQKQIDNLKVLAKQMFNGFEWLCTENLDKVLVFNDEKYKVVGATSVRSGAKVIITPINPKTPQDDGLFTLASNSWMNAGMREQLYFE